MIVAVNQDYMSRVMRKPTFWFSTRSDTNRAVQSQKTARGLKFRIKKVEGLYYLCSENKGADQLREAKLICIFVFAYAKCLFSHDASQLWLLMDSVDSRFLHVLCMIDWIDSTGETKGMTPVMTNVCHSDLYFIKNSTV